MGLEHRFQNSRTIPGTRKLHSFIPLSIDTLLVKFFSNSDDYKEEKVSKQEKELEIDEVSGFVTCKYEDKWWLSCILNSDAENAEVEVTFLHPHGPSRSYKYPSIPDLLILPVTNILTKVSPKTTTGHIYTLSQKENREATAKLTSAF